MVGELKRYCMEGFTSTLENYGFPDAYIIPTTPEQDTSASLAFEKESAIPYSLSSHQSADVTQTVLKSASVNVGNKRAFFPNTLIKYVIKNNNGEKIHRQ